MRVTAVRLQKDAKNGKRFKRRLHANGRFFVAAAAVCAMVWN